MKKILLIIFLIISYVCFSQNVYANSISNINMDVYIDINGNAYVVETLDTNVDKGTEWYHSFEKLEDKKIIDFSVTDDNGNLYTDVGNWNPKWSFDEKKYKSGINYTNDGIELCFGLSEYGHRTYTLKYTITNFITQYTDAQGTYTDNGYYQSANSSGIAGTLQTVFDQLSTSIAGTGATLTDNIGSSFSVDANSSNLITVTESSVSNTDKFDITEQGTKISFDVEINGDEADGWVNVNEGFALTYTDANGEEKTITYGANEPQPQVYWERNTYNYVINYFNTSDIGCDYNTASEEEITRNSSRTGASSAGSAAVTF